MNETTKKVLKIAGITALKVIQLLGKIIVVIADASKSVVGFVNVFAEGALRRLDSE